MWDCLRRSLVAWGGGLALIAGLGVIGLSSAAEAAPGSLAYTGELRAENGVLYTGSIGVTASLHSGMSGDDMIWGPADLGDVAVMNGLFQIALEGGSLDSVLDAHDDVWMEITIDGTMLAPRQRIRSVPYARIAADSQSLGGTDAGDFVTQTTLENYPVAAFTAEAAPEDPVAGQLWLDSATSKLHVWANGAWEPVSASGLVPDDLPGDGLNAVSNGTLSNEFIDVQADWTDGPAALPDNTSSGTNAIIELAEGNEARLYDITIFTELSLDVVSQLTITLQPPVSTGVAPITLFSGTVAAPGDSSNVPMAWDLASTPELLDLINQGPAGQWVLNVADTELTVTSAPFEVGAVEAFSIVYNVLRSDEIVMSGDMAVTGNADIGQDLNVGGTIHSRPIIWSGGCTAHGQASSWQTYCTDRTDFSTISGYLDIPANGLITVQRSGYYRVNAFAIAGGGGGAGTCHVRLIKNGDYIYYGHEYYSGSGWTDVTMDMTWPFDAGDTMYVEYTRCGNYAWHLDNGQGAHSKLQINYVGPK